ncbi:MAG: hypothetical protein K0Q95_235 [Bacteroidota bacterium]|jgi:hypothetical protein|nr:hypothetical protein [Bacteroidota bacterium]
MKNIFIAILTIISLNALALTPYKNGKVIMIISIEVKDFSVWKKNFDAAAPIREKAGIKVLSVCSSAQNENQVVVIEEAEDAQTAHNFILKLQSKQKDGDVSKLDIKMYDKAE